MPRATAPTLWAAAASHLDHLAKLNARPGCSSAAGSPEGSAAASRGSKGGRDVAAVVPTPQTVGGLAFLDQLAAFHYTSVFQGGGAR